MNLKVLGSSSSGNCYILENEKEALVIEAGVSFKEVKKALNYNISKIVGVLVTHEHGDHAKCIHEYLDNRINVYASQGTIQNCKKAVNHQFKAKVIRAFEKFEIGGFKVNPFDVQHDVEEPLGFFIDHSETGNFIFATDTYYLKYTFKDLANIIIECNYSRDILYENIGLGRISGTLKNRTLKSHMSYDNCVEALKANDLSKVNNIVLIHLSDTNSNEIEFQKGIKELTGKNVFVAKKGLEIMFNNTPF